MRTKTTSTSAEVKLTRGRGSYRVCPKPKAFACEYEGCDKAFTRPADLQRHENTVHYQLKPFKCEWEDCEAAFSARALLDNHMNTHTGDKPHMCGICPAAFGDRSSCTRHRVETHSICKLYMCEVPGCSARIKRRSGFNAHLKKKHGLPPLSPLPRGSRIKDIVYEDAWEDDMEEENTSCSSEERTPSPSTNSSNPITEEDIMMAAMRMCEISLTLNGNVDHSKISYLPAYNQPADYTPLRNFHFTTPAPMLTQDFSTNFMQPSAQLQWGATAGLPYATGLCTQQEPFALQYPLTDEEMNALTALACHNL